MHHVLRSAKEVTGRFFKPEGFPILVQEVKKRVGKKEEEKKNSEPPKTP